MEQHSGKPIDPCQISVEASTMMDVNDEPSLQRLMWVVYDGVLLLGDMPMLSRQHSLDRILNGAHVPIYRGKESPKHCPSCTVRSANTEQ